MRNEQSFADVGQRKKRHHRRLQHARQQSPSCAESESALRFQFSPAECVCLAAFSMTFGRARGFHYLKTNDDNVQSANTSKAEYYCTQSDVLHTHNQRFVKPKWTTRKRMNTPRSPNRHQMVHMHISQHPSFANGKNTAHNAGKQQCTHVRCSFVQFVCLSIVQVDASVGNGCCVRRLPKSPLLAAGAFGGKQYETN